MRRIERTNTFKRDYKRVKATPEHRDLDLRLSEVLKLLAADIPLPRNLYDHPLTGGNDHRDCHIKPDLLLIYRKPDTRVLQLVRLGSHSELGL
ncbi:MAG: type II toxin-antitoxin system RelE/ParE family toxin [Gammaproteobacteria bacterium]